MIYVLENICIPWLQTEMLMENELQNSAQWLERQYFLWMLESCFHVMISIKTNIS
jgi:hypothetical protein